MVCAEFAPLAKTGGLADAIAGLSAALGRSGHDVRVLLPKYAPLPQDMQVLDSIGPRGAGYRYDEIRLPAAPMRVYVLDAPHLFGDGPIYTGDDRDAARFATLAEAGARFGEAVQWTPDVVHCHDWHAALVPLLLRTRSRMLRQSSVLTLHNIGYQGIFPTNIFDPIPAELAAQVDASADPPTVNFLRAGVEAADLLTTVSPTYAREIQTAAYGMGLEDVLRARSADLVGILNGVDYSIWDPRVDPYLDAHYARDDTPGKQRVKQALCARLGLPYRKKNPVIGVVTRLVAQKGIDLLVALLPELLEQSNAAFALLGAGDPELEEALTGFAADAPERVSFTRGYDEALAHRILAGSDIVLVPSRYEPCGLTQMYALRFGTIPVVRATGGLADTVQHFDPGSGVGNGSVFEHADSQGLAWGISEALAWFADESAWRNIVRNAMAADYSWDHQVGEYLAAYRRLSK
jgi:starch synthase